MPKNRRLVAFAMTVALLLATLSLPVTAQGGVLPSLPASAAVLIEMESGDVIIERNASARLPMASTTKIMTALVALELAPSDTRIIVDAAAVGAEGSSVYLCAGEVLTLEQLLYALLLESANDAALAIAIGLCGSVEAFADLMNRKAEALGLTDTHFVNPHGLDDKAHYTTARELATVTQAALQNELFARIVSTRRATIPHAENPTGRLLINHNKLLRTYPDCVGVKTGYTTRSGRCLVSAATRDGVTLIAVTLNAAGDWQLHADMLDYGFTRYHTVTLSDTDTYRVTLPVVGGERDLISLTNESALSITLPVGHGSIRAVTEAPHFLYAPVMTGENIGKAVFYCDTDGDGCEEIIGELPLIACESVSPLHPPSPFASFWAWICGLFGKS